MQERFITVSEYVRHFGLVVLSGFDALDKKKITEMSINRPGFELCGFFDSTDKTRMVIIGNKEMEFIKSQGENNAALIEAYDFLTNDICPAVVICRNLECPQELLEIANKKKFPVLSTPMTTSELNVKTFTYLQKELAPRTSLHASLMEIYSMGVLILGESGIGKSETTLELIKKGHKLIADDRVNITAVGDSLYGEAPELLSGVMEVRGIGIIDVGRMFGINSLLKNVKISYAINLTSYKQTNHYDRLGNSVQVLDILNHNIPYLDLPVSGARSMADIIEVAVTNLKLKEYGIDSTFEFENRMNELLRRKESR